MTDNEKLLRRAARRRGRLAKVAINNALHPVYDFDGLLFEHTAAVEARAAAHFAVRSLDARTEEG